MTNAILVVQEVKIARCGVYGSWIELRNARTGQAIDSFKTEYKKSSFASAAKRSIKQAIEKAKQVFMADVVIVDSNASNEIGRAQRDFVLVDEVEIDVYSD